MTEALAETAIADVEPYIAKVLSKDGKLLFEGLVADAEQFIADHFPRLHVIEGQEPTPDYQTQVTQGGKAVDVPVAVPVTSQPSGVATTPATPTADVAATPDVSAELDALKATVATLTEQLTKVEADVAATYGPVD